jgi:hypothetical protein
MPDEDPYFLEGYPDDVRKFLKVSLNTVINAANESEAISAIITEAREWERERERAGEASELPVNAQDVRRLIRRFEQKHRLIENRFYRGAGIELQYTDSLVAEDVMLALGDLGIPVLPIHDSFRVDSQWGGALEDLMYAAFEVHCDAPASLRPEVGSHVMLLEWESVGQSIPALFTDAMRENYPSYYKRQEQWSRRQNERPPVQPRDSGTYARYRQAISRAGRPPFELTAPVRGPWSEIGPDPVSLFTEFRP